MADDLGAQLTAGLGSGLGGSALELWPTISYGNPGNATVLNNLLHSPTASAQFIKDAVTIAHKQMLSGFNWDIETSGTDAAALHPFLDKFTKGDLLKNPCCEILK